MHVRSAQKILLFSFKEIFVQVPILLTEVQPLLDPCLGEDLGEQSLHLKFKGNGAENKWALVFEKKVFNYSHMLHYERYIKATKTEIIIVFKQKIGQ